MTERLFEAYKNYSIREFGSYDGPDPYSLGLMYTTDEDDDRALQCYADFIGYKVYLEVDGEPTDYIITFDGADELATYLDSMSFDDFYAEARGYIHR